MTQQRVLLAGTSGAIGVRLIPPLASSLPHRHPGSVTAYVLKGTLRSQLA
ncbi:hypothetical protein ABEG18_22325 [Alsobacter sp. KACC 23698]|uniref:Uncharacterized protein n=1 Tax=Alsobacter sp. KACC 23698 TaxID=3149229 RepID=A0AAU7JDM3_9HYPH